MQYREYKIILQPALLSSIAGFHEYSKVLRHVAKELDIALFHCEPSAFRVREVLFFDTPHFELYEQAFILRRRTPYQDGWPIEPIETTLKFRHPDVERAAEIDVRPDWRDTFRIKFKEELLPLPHQGNGLRSLFSHNCVLMAADLTPPGMISELCDLFPAVRALRLPPHTKLSLVNNLAIEEVLTDLGEIHFGHGLQAKCTLAVWRNRGTQAPLSGELAFQCKFRRYDDLHDKSRKLSEQFFRAMQTASRDWISLGVTKTALVYRSAGAAPKHHE